MSYIGNTPNPAYQNFARDRFNGGAATHTLSYAPGTPDAIAVFVSGVYQDPTNDYTVSGTTLTPSTVWPSGTNNVVVIYLAQPATVVVPADGSITSAKLVSGITLTNSGNTIQTLTDATTTSWNATSGAIALWTMAGSRTLAAPTGLVTGGRYVLIITQDATGGRQITWNSVFKNSASSMPQPNTQANAVTAFTFTSPDGTNLRLESNEAKVLLATATASSSATLDFINLIGFSHYVFEFSNIVPATDAAGIWVRVSSDNGATWLSGGTDYAIAGFNVDTSGASGVTANNGTSLWGISPGISNASSVGASGTVKFLDFNGSRFKHVEAHVSTYQAVTGYVVWSGLSMLYHGSTTALNGVRFLLSSGNISTGIIKCYGIRG